MTPCDLVACYVTNVADEYTRLYGVTFWRRMMLVFTAVRSLKCSSVYFAYISILFAVSSRLEKKTFPRRNIEIRNYREEANFTVLENTNCCPFA
jgi:hypothetical protein